MERRIRDRFNDRIVEEASSRYGTSSEKLVRLDGFESYIFKYASGSEGFVLRIAHSIRRSENLIQAEAEWIRYLASKGVSVADAVPSQEGNLVEAISDGEGGCFLVTAFKEVIGKPPRVCGLSPSFYTAYGSLLGKMHRLAKSYIPLNPLIQRPLWDSQEINGDVLANIPPERALVSARYREILSTLTSLPVDRDSFGLIHFDAHCGNMLVEESGRINLFDFDDCNRNWFCNDLAIVLFYMVTNAQYPVRLATEFLPPFLRGYAVENNLDPEWLFQIPLFMRMREIDLYAVIHRSFNVGELTGWCKMFMEGRAERIENAIPYLDLDFKNFAKYMK